MAQGSHKDDHYLIFKFICEQISETTPQLLSKQEIKITQAGAIRIIKASMKSACGTERKRSKLHGGSRSRGKEDTPKML